MDTFNQLQEMDDDEDEREFSRGIVWTYFDQVPEKLEVIRTNLCVAVPSPVCWPDETLQRPGLVGRRRGAEEDVWEKGPRIIIATTPLPSHPPSHPL